MKYVLARPHRINIRPDLRYSAGGAQISITTRIFCPG